MSDTINDTAIEALAAQLGTRGGKSCTAAPAVEQLEEAAFPILLRVLQDANLRRYLWEVYGRRHEGESVFAPPTSFESPLLDATLYDQLLIINTMDILGDHQVSGTEPFASALQAAWTLIEATRPPLDSLRADSSWQEYNDACDALDLDRVRRSWQSLTDAGSESAMVDLQNALDGGMFGALIASEQGITAAQAAVLEFLLERGGDIDTSLHANLGCTALQYAAEGDDLERVRWLIAHGADVNKPDWDGKTPLMFAVQGSGVQGQRDSTAFRAVLATLLKAGADPAFRRQGQDDEDDEDGFWPTLWEFTDAESEAVLADLGVQRPLPDAV